MPSIPNRPSSPDLHAAAELPASSIRIDKGKQRAYDPPLDPPPADDADTTARATPKSHGQPPTSPLDAAFAPQNVMAAPVAARSAGTDTPSVRVLTDGWEEAAHGSRSTVHILYTPTGQKKPIELIVSLSKRHHFTKEACAGDSADAVARREEFAAFLANLMTQCEKHRDIQKDWQRIQLTVDNSGKLQHVAVFVAGPEKEVPLTENDRTRFTSLGRWMHNLVRGHETIDVRRADTKRKSDGPSRKELDEKAAEARQDAKAQQAAVGGEAASPKPSEGSAPPSPAERR